MMELVTCFVIHYNSYIIVDISQHHWILQAAPQDFKNQVVFSIMYNKMFNFMKSLDIVSTIGHDYSNLQKERYK
jgi:hypothetical protein